MRILRSDTRASVAAPPPLGTCAGLPGRARYNEPMIEWSHSKRAGFALAALLAGDRELGHVAPAISPELARDAALLFEQPSLRDKSRLVAHLLSFVRPPLTRLADDLPARLAAAIASKLPRSLARTVIAGAPLARAGFQLEPDLLPRLLRLARRSIDGEAKPS